MLTMLTTLQAEMAAEQMILLQDEGSEVIRGGTSDSPAAGRKRR